MQAKGGKQPRMHAKGRLSERTGLDAVQVLGLSLRRAPTMCATLNPGPFAAACPCRGQLMWTEVPLDNSLVDPRSHDHYWRRFSRSRRARLSADCRARTSPGAFATPVSGDGRTRRHAIPLAARPIA